MIRGRGWRSGDWTDGAEPTAAALDAVTGGTPAALISKDGHSLWLNSAALALAGGDLEVEGGVVERDERGEPTGVLREESAWRFRERHLGVPDDVYVEAMRAGLQGRGAARASPPCTTRTAGSARSASGAGSRRPRR